MSKKTPEELPKPTNEECIEMGKAKKQWFQNNRENLYLNIRMKIGTNHYAYEEGVT